MAQLDIGGRNGAPGRPDAPGANASILREDLVAVMRGRFERRLTVITAGAGFGKSTLLGQAMAENRLEQMGHDVWVPLNTRDQEPDQLLAAIAAALDLEVIDPSVDQITEFVWSRAPASVALFLDDTHHLGSHRSAWKAVVELLDRLPGNGHLVLSGRAAPLVGLNRLLSVGEATVIDEQALAFSAKELDDFATLRGISSTIARDLPNWPALATLTGAVGKKAGLGFLWEEVLQALPEKRVGLLAAAAPFTQIDDGLVTALGGASSAEELVDGLPLVEATEDGSFRLHALWSDALSSSITAEARRQALQAGAAHLLKRGELVRAAEASAAAGDEEGLRMVVLAFAAQPSLSASTVEIDRLHALLPDSMASRPTALYLEAARHYATDDRLAANLFARTATSARRANLPMLEVLALWRVVQFEKLDHGGTPTVLGRVAELAESDPMAAGTLEFVKAAEAMERGEPELSMEHFAKIDGFGPEQLETSRSIHLMDVGRPESIPATLESILTEGLSDIFAALAVWFQGEINPADAWPLARGLPEQSNGQVAITRIGVYCSTATMAVVSGNYDEALTLAQRAHREASVLPVVAALFADVALAVAELVAEDEAACTRRLTQALAEAPLGAWPIRPYLWALSTIRGLVPGTEVLDECSLGPSLTVAVQAGAALAALRVGDAGPAAALPWERLNLLRVHVPPPLLAELALAVPDDPAAAAVLADLPSLRRWVRRVTEREGHPAAAAAAVMLSTLPVEPDFQLHVTTLGEFTLTRSDGSAPEGWDRRGRVRTLMAMLVMRGRLSRSAIAEELWPDLPVTKAKTNLRVNLHHLQAALQPDREADEPSWFVHSDGDSLELATDCVVIDHQRLDAVMAQAVQDEARGLATRALDGYATVCELYGGDLLGEFDQEWAMFERIRLASVAHAAAARRGELELARGEPEVAMKLALDAQRLDSLSQRAHRLFVNCHQALGSTGAARQAAQRFRAELAANDIAPERDTASLWRRLDLQVQA